MAQESDISRALGVAASGLMPKSDIQADIFVAQNPTYDGRGVTVAIFDTGIDPGVPGLQNCPDGRPKVVDLVDCTGSGDVNTTTEVTTDSQDNAADQKTIKGLTGRKLKLNPEWSNPSDKWRVGILQGYKVFSRALVKRLKSERRKEWDKHQDLLLLAARQRLQAFDVNNPDPNKTDELQAQRKDLADACEALEAMRGSYEDLGPVFDVIAWYDGLKWRAAVDTSEKGDLTKTTAFTNFHDERQWGTFSDRDLCTYGINIYDNGDVVSVVVAAGAHGSHVAGIVAAHDPEHPELNGMAPGAQIVCCKIGDSRLGSMETALGLERAANVVLRNKVDIINMSYGEPVCNPHHGRVVDVYRTLVRRHGVIFVTSAGNAGPALSTVGAPASSCSSDVIAVGAYVSPHMMKAQYSLASTPPSVTYTWSSRGPTRLGTRGVSICAPGGAVSSAPSWTLQRNMHMNGTSMSSPNACGGIALIVSGLKSRGIKYTPYRVRRAIENTAQPVPGVEALSQGCGLLQVAAAFEHIVAYANFPSFGLKMNIRCNGLLGVYLREPHEVGDQSRFSAKVHVTAGHHPDATQQSKVDLDTQVALVHTQPWIAVPALFNFHNKRGFELDVDMNTARRSSPGNSVHYGEIHGFDTSLPREAGPLFRVPVTYLSPSICLESTDKGSLLSSGSTVVNPVPTALSPLRYVFPALPFSPGTIHRRVLHVPANVSRFTITLRPSMSWGGGDNGANNRLMTVHCQQLVPELAHRDSMLDRYLWFNRTTTKSLTARCTPGRTMEVVIAQFWNSNVGDCSADIEVEFAGVNPHVSTFGDGIVVEAKQGFARVDVTAPWGAAPQSIAPAAKLTHIERAIHPEKFSILPSTDRIDQTPQSRNEPTVGGYPVYVLNLEYKFEVATANVYTVHAAALSEILYENPFGSQMRIIYDSNGRVVGSSDTWGDNYSTQKLEKGKYTVRMALRHPDPEILEGAKGLIIKLRSKLSKPISLNCYDSLPLLLSGGKTAKVTMRGGESKPFFFKAPNLAAEAVGKDAVGGAALVGTTSWLAEGKHPDSTKIRAVVCAVANKAPADAVKAAHSEQEKSRIAKAVAAAKASARGTPEPEKFSLQALQTQITNVRIKHLAAIHEELGKQMAKSMTATVDGSSSSSGGDKLEDSDQQKTSAAVRPEVAAASAAGLWQAQFDERYNSKERDESLTLKLLNALLDKEQAVLFAVEGAIINADPRIAIEVAGKISESCQSARVAVENEWKVADIAVALARQKPKAADAAAAEAFRLAEEKQQQLFRAEYLSTRALNLCARTATKDNEECRKKFNVAFKALRAHKLASSDANGGMQALTLLGDLANGHHGTVLKTTHSSLKSIATGDGKNKMLGLDRNFLQKTFVASIRKATSETTVHSDSDEWQSHWLEHTELVEVLRKPKCYAKL